MFEKPRWKLAKIQGVGFFCGFIVILLIAYFILRNHGVEFDRYQKINVIHNKIINDIVNSENNFYQTTQHLLLYALTDRVPELLGYNAKKEGLKIGLENLTESLDHISRNPIGASRKTKAPDSKYSVFLAKRLLSEKLYEKYIALGEKILAVKETPSADANILLQYFKQIKDVEENFHEAFQKLIRNEQELILWEKERADRDGWWVNFLARLVIVMAIFTIAVVFVFTKLQIGNPVEQMTDVAIRIASGDLDQEVNVKSQTELGVLAKAFNRMTKNLKDTIQYQKDQINKILVVVDAVAQGNFTTRVEVTSTDEFGKLGERLNKMIDNLSFLVSQVDVAVERVTKVSSDILQETQEQATGVTEQVAQLSDVATSLRELTATSKQIAMASANVSNEAEKASHAALSGGRSVEDSIQAMTKISATVLGTAKKIRHLGEESRKISKVVTTIQDIAEQINLLALNAAIEAARAGEQGRGFAVVADEVRKLAERSSQFTEEINALISTIQAETNSTVMAMEEGTKSVEEGANLIDGAGASLRDIISLVEHTTELAREISLSTDQQTRGNEQVTGAMESLAQVVKQAEKSAHRTTSSAKSLTDLAQDLQKTTEVLVVKGYASH